MNSVGSISVGSISVGSISVGSFPDLHTRLPAMAGRQKKDTKPSKLSTRDAGASPLHAGLRCSSPLHSWKARRPHAKQTNGHKDRQAGRQTDNQTDRQTDRHTDGQTDKQNMTNMICHIISHLSYLRQAGGQMDSRNTGRQIGRQYAKYDLSHRIKFVISYLSYLTNMTDMI